MRCFVGITPPQDVLDVLERVAARSPVGRVPPRENLHLTLAFLDEITEPQAREVHRALSGIRHAPFGVAFAGLDLFGGDKSQIVHAAVRAEPALLQLHEKVMRACRTTGLALHRVRFRPHVTLARMNAAPKGAGAERLASYLGSMIPGTIPGFDVESFSLFQSVLGHGAAQHTELARYELRSDDGL